MATITEQAVRQGDSFITTHQNVSTNSNVDYTFPDKQSTIYVINKGTSEIRVTVNEKIHRVKGNTSVKIEDDNDEGISLVTIVNSYRTNGQPFEIIGKRPYTQAMLSGTPTQTPAPTTAAQEVKLRSTSKKEPTIVFLLDDTAAIHYDTMNEWINRGVRYTTGVRLDFITGYMTFAKLREMQDNGFELAYHGQNHDGLSGGTVQLANDIPAFMTIAKAENLKINGFIGPGGVYDENIVFHTYFDTFRWARGGGASNGVANVKSAVDFFKQISASNSFIDDLSTQAAADTLKTKIDTLATRGTGIMTLSMHLDAAKAPYLHQILDYILSKGIKIKTVSEAYETYGAIMEYYDSSLILGSDFAKRETGNGGISINSAYPHFILMKDGTVISNTAGLKRVPPVYKGQQLTGNTLPDSFDVGISVIQYGSIDNRAGFPTTGTLYNFNLGKNPGEQFQLFKGTTHAGLYYREANTNNTWKSLDKLGIFRPVPASKTAAGAKGDFSADANYAYFCIADNSWIRVAKDATW